MNIRRKLAVSSVAAVLATLSAVGLAGTAHAGTNGQQIVFQDRLGTVYSINLWGNDQNGNLVEHCFATPRDDNYLTGWWWKGYVGYTGWSNSDCTGTQVVVKPNAGYVEEYWNTDWWWITD
ncbi:hypothetical protein ABTX77_03590 [Streptomyces sp. NPDC097704]|uniref:hypothetical protein n=1 Tax=unclassified Streptomyces TaxID=2593676 RepID=UPI003322C853